MPPLSVLIKPASSLCDMRCEYCFYADEARNRAVASYGLMTEETLSVLMRRAFEYGEGEISFGFQGGEPTLAGLDFFKKVVELEDQYNTRRLRVRNALQTNGLHIDAAFAAFLAKNGFLTGLSLDGGRETHDLYRRDAKGEGTFERVQKAAKTLARAGADFNVLCVVTEEICRAPEKTFEALRRYQYLQFIPCLPPIGGDSPFSPRPESYARFLSAAFRLYYEAFQKGFYVSVRDFDNYIRLLRGERPENCAMGGACAGYFLVESDGGVYPCDFYVLDEWRVGDIRERGFAAMKKSEPYLRFLSSGAEKAAACDACPYAFLCRGGCRRHRDPATHENRFCASYRAFFAEALPLMKEMARKTR